MARGPKRNPANKLERWEVALVKRLLMSQMNDQDILAYFTRPTRSINHARIAEIRSGEKHKAVAAATEEELAAFLQSWPQIDPKTGLHIRGDERLIKAREAMLSAVQGYNDPKTYFKSEIFICVAVIAYTYLLHWYYCRNGVDIRHLRAAKDRPGTLEVIKTKHGADKLWELEACLQAEACPLDEASKANLRFLLEIRHEIEHQMTTRIDDAISAKLQACCLNFNRAIKDLAGAQYGLDGELSFSLQFSTIDREQRDVLLAETALPAHIQAAHIAFEDAMTDEMVADPRYSYRVAYIEQSVNSKGKADQVVEFIKSDSERGEKLRLLLKETERPKLKPAQVVEKMKAAGYTKFSIYAHTQLWQAQDAKAAGKNFGVQLTDGQWYWYPNWVDFVSEQLEADRDRWV